MLAARVATALVLVSLLLGALFLLSPLQWRLLAALIVAVAAWEFAGLAAFASAARLAYGLLTGALSWGLGHVEPGVALPVFGAAAAFWLLVAPLWLARRWRIDRPVAAMLAGWMVLLPPGLALVLLREAGDGGPLLLLAVMAMVWVADIAAYFVGRRLGRRKLAVEISPGKTWEGAWGAAIFVLIYGYAAFWGGGLMDGASLLTAGALALLLLGMTAVSIVGDLFESLLKRQAGMKDSSHLLPGHGGLLDRIDSLTSTLPLAGLALLIWRG